MLGCTEIELLLGPDDVDVPVFATTRLHALAAVDFALAAGGVAHDQVEPVVEPSSTNAARVGMLPPARPSRGTSAGHVSGCRQPCAGQSEW